MSPAHIAPVTGHSIMYLLLLVAPLSQAFVPNSLTSSLTSTTTTTTRLKSTTNELQPWMTNAPADERPFETKDMQVLTDISLPVEDGQLEQDAFYMNMALEMAQDGDASPFPQAPVGAVLVAADGRVLGKGRSDYNTHAIEAVFENAGLDITPLSEWCVTWPASEKLRKDLAGATLYVTLEPSMERQGTAVPPMTQLIQSSAIKRIVIGCADPVASRATKGAALLHSSGISVSLGVVLEQESQDLIYDYAQMATSKLHRMARNHFRMFGRPLGFLHCSVVNSNDIGAFQRHGNAFGTLFNGKLLSFRDFGSYEIAPPPEVIWADDRTIDEADETANMFNVDFEEESLATESLSKGNPMMPWYEQVDAVVATFPRYGNGPPDDQSVIARLSGLKWLATHGERLPPGVERVLVMDATDLPDLPFTNDDPNLPKGVDIEKFWKSVGRKPTRVLLRRGANEQARAAAAAAAQAAEAAAAAAKAAAEAIEIGDAERSAEAALDYQKLAKAETDFVQRELEKTLKLKTRLQEYGVKVETVEGGGEPVHIMKHLGKRNGYKTVVWRAGCWGGRGVRAILAGAFQWVSAHLAVDANGGRFWQLMMAENAVQAACGPKAKVKVFADQEDISLEYCDEPEADSDCSMTFDGRPIRHIRLDCRVALVVQDRPRDIVPTKVTRMDRQTIEEQAPWFL